LGRRIGKGEEGASRRRLRSYERERVERVWDDGAGFGRGYGDSSPPFPCSNFTLHLPTLFPVRGIPTSCLSLFLLFAFSLIRLCNLFVGRVFSLCCRSEVYAKGVDDKRNTLRAPRRRV